jgi:hypothetical protein
VYKEYLLNYKKAVATVQKCSQDNEQFHDLAKSIKGKGIQGSESLERRWLNNFAMGRCRELYGAADVVVILLFH